jgi:hypothetical protein
MHTRRIWALGATIGALTLAAGAALALPGGQGLSEIGQGVSTEALIEKVHGCHRSCQWGPGRGWWHRHVGPLCRPVACEGSRPPGFWDEPGYRRYPFVYRYRRGCRITPWGEVFCRF